MSKPVHPDVALFEGERPFPVLASCEHFAGSEKLINKAFGLQDELGPVFDITCDCEDGAQAGRETEHAEMVASLVNSDANKFSRAGARIHDYTHDHWRKDVDILVKNAGEKIAYITVPKSLRAQHAEEVVTYIQEKCRQYHIKREIPVHILIETHGALREVWQIASLPWVEVLDFGMMDFVSAHQGAIPASAMRSPGQFAHPILQRAKTEMVAAAIANGVVASHNVTLDLKNPEQTSADAKKARYEFGFLRMWSIYPTQIKAIVDAMKPDFSEVVDACEILLAAQKNSWGPIQHKGELHDRATYRYFWTLLKRAQKSGVEISAEATKAFF